MTTNQLPRLIQGGMGVAVSDWKLARAVSLQGELGVVSGTAIDAVLARRLQLGDPGGHLRRAISAFPLEGVGERILERFLIEGGKPTDAPFKSLALLKEVPTRKQLELLIVANFVEVFLAKENHDGLVGINLLEKIQLPTLPSLYGAMLAGVDYVLMGAGIPRLIPGILDFLAEGRDVELPLDIAGADTGERFVTRFSPKEFHEACPVPLSRPRFLGIVSSATLATMLARKSTGTVDGFVVEGYSAGGHNASPRGKLKMNRSGEPIYGERDIAKLDVFRKLGLPFWLAGSFGTPEKLREAQSLGATGVQLGTAFAFCNESGLSETIKRNAIELSRRKQIDVFTDPLASPTGFPFKLLRLSGSMSEPANYEQRERVCDLGYLRHGYKRQDGTIGWRCPAERVDLYLKKGGGEETTVGRKCICNGLFANVGLGQVRERSCTEQALVTCGTEASNICSFLPSPNATGYSARDVIQCLLGERRFLSESRFPKEPIDSIPLES